ncbi:malic enzyme-like NAD(P)-binding protein [Halodesulfovibrio aestuarii]|uniref:Malic enzyme-like NAD(P)-binding protein n=1 Tax=Halodesulfovibrio aestuarii TaxID=126333 RepID=A0ABV4JU85_9BACT
MALFTKEEALAYHEAPRRGKTEVIPAKPCNSQKDLSMAYSPGVAEACLAIKDNPETAALYTGRSNLVGVVTDGSAVLGLGNIGPLAGKPVMEGKGVLFKTFADIDVFDINLSVNSAEQIIEITKALEPTFGGINLEDIKAPECFHIEETLKKEMNIPVFHDDQHGTAVISGAGIINACEITGRNIEDLKVVVVGAGAAGIACSKFYVELGVKKENIFMFDSRGLIHQGREGLNKYKAEFAQDKNYGDLAECLKGAHCFLGLSVKDLLTKEMVKSMADSPIIFAMANPDPEIPYDDAKEAVPTCIMGTGRSDYPNQINNVSGFPYIFRGALDVGATEINEAMKVAAAKALAALAKEPVPAEICEMYDVESLEYGINYIIPKPLDPRILEWEVPAVAQAAMDTGVATTPIKDMEAYRESLRNRISASRERVSTFISSYDQVK